MFSGDPICFSQLILLILLGSPESYFDKDSFSGGCNATSYCCSTTGPDNDNLPYSGNNKHRSADIDHQYDKMDYCEYNSNNVNHLHFDFFIDKDDHHRNQYDSSFGLD